MGWDGATFTSSAGVHGRAERSCSVTSYDHNTYRGAFLRMYPETRRELPLLCRAYGVAPLRSIHSQHVREGSLARL